MRATVYVPKRGTMISGKIARGSGIVGRPSFDRHSILIDYEGNIFGASNIVTFADRVYIAAARQADNAPTTSRMSVSLWDVVEVGEFVDGRVQIYTSMAGELAHWLDIDAVTDLLDPRELFVSVP